MSIASEPLDDKKFEELKQLISAIHLETDNGVAKIRSVKPASSRQPASPRLVTNVVRQAKVKQYVQHQNNSAFEFAIMHKEAILGEMRRISPTTLAQLVKEFDPSKLDKPVSSTRLRMILQQAWQVYASEAFHNPTGLAGEGAEDIASLGARLSEISSIASRLVSALKPKAALFVPVLLAPLTMFTLTPAEAGQIKVNAISVPNPSKLFEGQSLYHGVINLKQIVRKESLSTIGQGSAQEALSALKMNTIQLFDALPETFLEGEVPADIEIPLSIFSAIQDDADFRGELGDLVVGAYQLHNKKYGAQLSFYLTGSETLSGARLAIAQELIQPYGFVLLGESKSAVAARFDDVEDPAASVTGDGKLHYPISRVGSNTLMGWFGKLYFMAANLRYFGRDGKLNLDKIVASDVPDELMEAQALLSAQRADKPTYSGILSGRTRDLVTLVKFKLAPLKGIIADFHILERLKRTILQSA